jgi:3-phenylpropionate/cinnamic acid dioxygenase small subunit
MSTDTELAARAALVFYAYARGVDDGDLEGLGRLVTDDVQVTRSDGELHGREGFLSLYRAFRDSPVETSQHVITNVQADREADGTIRARAYFNATMFDPDGGFRLIVGQYSDTLVEAGDHLLLKHKRITVQRAIKIPVDVQAWSGVAVAK